MRAARVCRPCGARALFKEIQGRRAFALAPGYLLAAPSALHHLAQARL
jgi:hypothetical protein